jgi:hypothetical protein
MRILDQKSWLFSIYSDYKAICISAPKYTNPKEKFCVSYIYKNTRRMINNISMQF